MTSRATGYRQVFPWSLFRESPAFLCLPDAENQGYPPEKGDNEVGDPDPLADMAGIAILTRLIAFTLKLRRVRYCGP